MDNICKSEILEKNKDKNAIDTNIKIKFLKNVINDSSLNEKYVHNFIGIKSIYDIFYIIYVNKYNSIICFNLYDNKKIIEIKNAHRSNITYIRYFFDTIKSRDLIISISASQLNIKLWNINNWECLSNIENIYRDGSIKSACFLKENNQNYILASNSKSFIQCGCYPIKVYDFLGNQIKEVAGSDSEINYIDSFYDNKLCKNYIITDNIVFLISYDFNEDKLYHIYYDNHYSRFYSFIIIDCNNIINLVASGLDGLIKIWNFHSKELLNIIKVSDRILLDICLWNDNYLFIGCGDGKIYLINLKSANVIKSFEGNQEYFFSIKTIIHPVFGHCLLYQGNIKNNIILWQINQ